MEVRNAYQLAAAVVTETVFIMQEIIIFNLRVGRSDTALDTKSDALLIIIHCVPK